jgi:F420-0:gamma-glutamyl ligase-like protein
MYITINDIILNGGTEFETKQPFEIFINSRDVSSFQWVTSLTRMISAVFRRGGDVSFIVRELLATYDTSGGYLARGGVYVPSLVAEIGLIIEKHFKSIGIISDDKVDPSIIKYVEDSAKEANIDLNTIKGEYCESCHHHSVIKIDGCASCVNCGASKCS